jgi:class 3 adenylate cyclase
MFYNGSIPSSTLKNWQIRPEFIGEDQAVTDFPLAWQNKFPTQSMPEKDTDRLISRDSRSNDDLGQLVQELTCLYQMALTAYERSQHLQAVVRPLLPQTTWAEATNMTQQGQKALPTENREVSILRLDIVGFTDMLDRYPVEQVLTDLNAYLAKLAHLVYRHNGDVDKYLGDGFLCIFNEADDAIEAACAIQKAVAEFNRQQEAKEGLVFPARVAVTTGQVVVTSLGSSTRQDRTVIGMPINLAERLQAQATPGQVWLSQETFIRLRDQSGCRCLGSIKVKGRQEPVVVYEKQ